MELIDEMLGAFEWSVPVDTIAGALRNRCEGVVDRVLPIFTSQECINAALQDFRR